VKHPAGEVLEKDTSLISQAPTGDAIDRLAEGRVLRAISALMDERNLKLLGARFTGNASSLFKLAKR
jgi:hypothetical protein